MKMVVFKAGDGDSMLIQGEQANILVDGGRKTQFKGHVAPVLESLHENGQALDLVCVSHIDDDHITGIVELYRRRTEWAVHHLGTTAEPNFGEPPVIKRLWHNAFDETVADAGGGTDASNISNQLAFHGQLISAMAAMAETEYGQRFGRIAQGARLAIELDLRFKQSSMNIEFNGPSNGALIEVGDDPLVTDVNGIAINILSPFHEDLVRLRASWDKWVNNNQDKIAEMKDKFSQRFGTMDALEFLKFAASQAELGEFDAVQPPNLASITFMLQENGQRILMTGDHASDGKQVPDGEPLKRGVLEGLAHAGLIQQPDGGLHVNVLKVPHHGATANTSVEFARRVTADHYVFCANGRHHNPEVEVIEAYVNSRLSDDDQVRSGNPEAGNRFKLWFNYHPDDEEISSNQNYIDQMTLAKNKVEELAAGDQFDFEFSQQSNFSIDLDADD